MFAFNQPPSPGCREELSSRGRASSIPHLWSRLLRGVLHLPLPGRKILYESLYEEAREIVGEHFVDVTRLKDWHKWQHKFHRQISSEEELDQAIRQMLDALQDPHTRLIGGTESQKGKSGYPEAVQSNLLDGGIGYVRLRHFQTAGLADLVARHLVSLRAARSLILDLRHNPGGSLMEAVDVAALFLKEGRVVSLRVRSGGSGDSPHYINCTYSLTPQLRTMETTCSCDPSPLKIIHEKRNQYLADHRPLVVLVDDESASSAELLIGALKDNHAATVMGCRSFGKGVGQDLLPLWNGAQIRLTTFQFRTPGGFWPGDGCGSADQGIDPDIAVQSTGTEYSGSGDRLLQAAIARLNRSSDRYVDAALVSLGRTLGRTRF